MAKVEVDKVLCFVRYEGPEISTNDAVPSGTLSLIKLDSVSM